MTATIRTAYTISRKGGLKTYRVRAYVEDRGVKHTLIVALGDTLDEALQDALRYVRDRHIADGVPAPSEHVDAGRVAGPLLDAWIF